MSKEEVQPTIPPEELTSKITDFLEKQSKKKVKDGVDFVSIIKKLKDRRAKKKNG